MAGNEAAQAGHNIKKTDDQIQQAIFVDTVSDVKRLKAELDSINGKLRQRYASAKVLGISKKEIDYAIRLEKEDDAEMIAERRKQQQIARWLGHPIGTQPDMFDGAEQPQESKATIAGRLAALRNEPRITPTAYAGGQPEQDWLSAYDDATATRNVALEHATTLQQQKLNENSEEGDDGQDEFDEVLEDDRPTVASSAQAARNGEEKTQEPKQTFSQKLAENNKVGDAMASGKGATKE